MKTALIVLFVCLAAVAARAQKKERSEEHFPKKKWYHWKEKKHAKLCKNLQCQEGEGCKLMRDGTATCVRCIECDKTPSDLTVCGSDGHQYNSICHFRQQICLQDRIGLIKIQCHSPCANCPGNQEFEKKKREQRLNLSTVDRNIDSKSFEQDGDGLLKRVKDNRRTKWLNWSPIRMELTPRDHCSSVENSTLAERLIDWFHILRADHLREAMEKKGIQHPNFVFREMKPQEARAPFPSGFEHRRCRDPINSMFDFLDENKNDILDASEITEIKNIPYEHCISKFFDACDQGQDGQFSRMEFCECFPVVPPCLRQRRLRTFMLKDDAVPLPGMYVPVCDEDGFFMPQQCKSVEGTGKKCWCVDRNGGKIEGSTGNCADNTQQNTEDAGYQIKEE